MKIYPLLIFPALIKRASWRFCLAVIAALTFGISCLGQKGFYHLLDSIQLVQNRPYFWHGNHSLASFCSWMGWNESIGGLTVFALLGFYLLSASLLFFFSARLDGWRLRSFTGDLHAIEAALIGLGITLMSLVTATSHDYKLVIHLLPFLLFSELLSNRTTAGQFSNIIRTVSGICFGLLCIPAIGIPKTPVLLVLMCAFSAQLVADLFGHSRKAL